MNLQYKKLIIIVILSLFSKSFLFSQTIKSFYVSSFYSMQKVDERHIGVSKPMLRLLNKWNSELTKKGTTHFGFEFGYKFIRNKKFSLVINTGWSKEITHFHRIFNQNALEDYTLILLSLDRYYYELINLGFNIKYDFLSRKNLKIHTGFSLNSFYRYKSYYHSRRDYYWDKKDFLSLELNPQIGIYYKNIDLDFYYRLFQIRKIDRALFEKNDSGYGALKNDYETYNLPKFGISLKYWFGFTRKKENKPINIDK